MKSLKEKEKQKFKNSCDGKGCSVRITLPIDSRINDVFGRVPKTKYDSKKIQALARIKLHKELEKKRQVEKVLS